MVYIGVFGVWPFGFAADQKTKKIKIAERLGKSKSKERVGARARWVPAQLLCYLSKMRDESPGGSSVCCVCLSVQGPRLGWRAAETEAADPRRPPTPGRRGLIVLWEGRSINAQEQAERLSGLACFVFCHLRLLRSGPARFIIHERRALALLRSGPARFIIHERRALA
jgi:hypothetical protein